MNGNKMDDNGNVTAGNDAVLCNATTHINRLEDMFFMFGVNIHEWNICQIEEN